jgi:hypothetical protein
MVPFGQLGYTFFKMMIITFFEAGNYLIGKNLPTGTGEDGKIFRAGVVHEYATLP